MSRVGKSPIVLQGAEVALSDERITVKGPLGTITQAANRLVKVVNDNGTLKFEPVDESREANAMSGTMRALVANMVSGVTKGFERKLTLVGVGYRAQAQGDKLNLSLGFSHPVVHQMPEGVKAETPSQTEIVIKGIDKQQVGQVAAEVRGYRPPEPYKGKGVRYANEVVILKKRRRSKGAQSWIRFNLACAALVRRVSRSLSCRSRVSPCIARTRTSTRKCSRPAAPRCSPVRRRLKPKCVRNLPTRRARAATSLLQR